MIYLVEIHNIASSVRTNVSFHPMLSLFPFGRFIHPSVFGGVYLIQSIGLLCPNSMKALIVMTYLSLWRVQPKRLVHYVEEPHGLTITLNFLIYSMWFS
jgi:hypothetical protein